jgi:hypothetical protein
MTALDVGDDEAALAARRRLGPLIDGIGDPYLRSVCQLAMAWIAPIVGDFEGTLRKVSATLDQLRVRDEPFWTAIADATAGLLETAAGRYDDALFHLTEMSDLAERYDNTWLAAWSRAQLGTLSVARGRLEEARTLLDEGLALSAAVHSSHDVTMCLAAFARLAFAEGDAERAALLAGATEGLRRRVGLRAWPILRRGESELVAHVREALGADRFDEVFAVGARLNRREAVAATRDRHGAVKRLGTPGRQGPARRRRCTKP